MSIERAARGVGAASAALLGGWFAVACAAVDAAQRAEPPDLLAFPWIHAGVAVVITTGAGTAATFARELAAKYADRPFHAGYEYRKDVAVSVLLGIGGYAAGWMLHASPAEVALGLILAGYAGTRALTAAVDRLLAMIRAQIAATGQPQQPTPPPPEDAP